jgi:MFS family permease
VRFAFFTIMGFAAGFMSPILSGLVLEHLGWQWIFNIIAILTAAILLAVFLFIPETTYHRTKDESEALQGLASEGTAAPIEHGAFAEPKPTRMSFAQRLWPIQYRISNQNFIMLVLRPYILLFHPAVLWVRLNSNEIQLNILKFLCSSRFSVAPQFPG